MVATEESKPEAAPNSENSAQPMLHSIEPDEDPLLIAQTLTYVTDDGSVVLSFQSAPFSLGTSRGIGEPLSALMLCRNVLDSSCLNYFLHRLQNSIHPLGSDFRCLNGSCSAYRCTWDCCCCLDRQSLASGLVLVQFGSIRRNYN